MKEDIDKFIELNHEKLLNIVRKKIRYYKRDVCEYRMLSEGYLYVCNNPPKRREDIPKYLVHWIDLELRMPKSNTNRKNAIDKAVEYWSWNSLDNSFEVDIESIDFKECMLSFVKTLDRLDQIVWKVYFEKGKTKIRELSEHFDIPESTINLYRVRLLERFKQHYLDYYED